MSQTLRVAFFAFLLLSAWGSDSSQAGSITRTLDCDSLDGGYELSVLHIVTTRGGGPSRVNDVATLIATDGQRRALAGSYDYVRTSRSGKWVFDDQGKFVLEYLTAPDAEPESEWRSARVIAKLSNGDKLNVELRCRKIPRTYPN